MTQQRTQEFEPIPEPLKARDSLLSRSIANVDTALASMGIVSEATVAAAPTPKDNVIRTDKFGHPTIAGSNLDVDEAFRNAA